MRERRAPVNEYRVDLSSPRLGQDKLVDLYVAPVSSDPGSVVVVFQERSMADKIDRQLTHRAAARSVTGLASMLAHEIKNPLSGIRGAAQLLEQSVEDDDRALTRLICDETDRIVSLVDRMEVFSDERPVDRVPVNIHSVLDHVKAVAKAGFARNIKISENYDPSLPAVFANRDQLVQVFLNLVKNAAEAVGDRQDGEIMLTTAYRPGIRLSVAGTREDLAAAGILRHRQWSGRAGRSRAASFRSVHHHQDERNRPRPCAGRQDHRRPRRHRRMRQPEPSHHFPCFDACLQRHHLRRCPTSELYRDYSMTATILVADDDAAIRTVLNRALSRAGYDVRITSNAATLWRWVSAGEGDLVVTDVVMPDENAFDLLPRIKKARPDLPVLVMSAQNTFMTAIKASEKGAYDYLPKPFDLTELIAIVGRALSEPKRKPAKIDDDMQDGMPLVGRSAAMQEIYRVLARLMQTDLTLMITGESGTGKELVARALHDYGKRRNGPFVAINMAAIPRDLIESELFGHEKGAFTGAQTRSTGRFEQAEGGTLFLDEIGDMPMDAQTRLLRVLQQGEYTTVGGRTRSAPTSASSLPPTRT